MRFHFKGTLVLLIVCLALGGYVYFYEIKGGEKREKAKEAEKQVWKFEGSDIQQIDLISQGQHISAVRKAGRDWILTSPRTLEADTDELNRLANSASNIQRESVVESNATNLAKYGLSPPKSSLEVKTKGGKQYLIDFGNSNPTGSNAYATIPGKKEVFLVSSSVVTAFDKKTDELRNQTILGFEQPEAQSLVLKSSKGELQLEKDSDDRWWLVGKEKVAADSPGVRGILNALSTGKVKEFFNEPAGEYRDLGFTNPVVDVRLTYGKNKGIKHLVIGLEKGKLQKKSPPPAPAKEAAEQAATQLYLAKDESRQDLFFVEKDLVDKLLKSRNDLRDKALASIQRWDVDSIALTNSKGNFAFIKSGGEWFLADKKKKAKWESVNAVLDVMEKPVKEWIDQPGPLSGYGLDKPQIRVILKKGPEVLADCSFGKAAKDGIYAEVRGDSSVKVADPEGLNALDKGETDFVEPPPAPADAKNKK